MDNSIKACKHYKLEIEWGEGGMASDTSKYLQTHILWKNKVDGINVCYLLRRNSGSNNKVQGDKVLFPEILQIPFTRKTLN